MTTKIRFRRKTEWPFVPITKPRRKWDWDRADNDDIFITWLVHKLRKCGGRNVCDGERLNALALSISPANLAVLQAHISGATFLNFAPKTDDSLRDSEIGVDMDNLYAKEK